MVARLSILLVRVSGYPCFWYSDHIGTVFRYCFRFILIRYQFSSIDYSMTGSDQRNEVRLQRNAPSVIEPATGHEDNGIIDMDENEINFKLHSGITITIIITTRILFLVIITIIMLIMTMILKNSITEDGSLTGHPQFTSLYLNYQSHLNLLWKKVDLSELEADTLSRYRRYFNLVDATGPNPSKDQLLEAVQRHFTSQKMDKFQVIGGFLNAAKRLKNLCT
ncbi:hypothetical protein ZOSMA_309G00050 [Zostera marina]|uniref:Histone deacetylase complex subunit SAP30 Sin3 binding domain-containing protein n=1 Tax=Zostera marina TaxID=29655 RepID=A0A0K9PA56_ZOSMR|nr:hypothetical protein ZOSMA_309G00050 [Zostera marina]